MLSEEALGLSLMEAFAKVPDPREKRGRRHPLPAHAGAVDGGDALRSKELVRHRSVGTIAAA